MGYEHYNNRRIKLEVLKKLADFYDTTVEYIEDGFSASQQSVMPSVIFVDSSTQKERLAFVPIAAQAGYVKHYNEASYLQNLATYSLPGFTNSTYRMFPIAGDSMCFYLSPGRYSDL